MKINDFNKVIHGLSRFIKVAIMYENLAILAAFIFLYSIIADKDYAFFHHPNNHRGHDRGQIDNHREEQITYL